MTYLFDRSATVEHEVVGNIVKFCIMLDTRDPRFVLVLQLWVYFHFILDTYK